MNLRRIFVLVLQEPACICGPGSGSSIILMRALRSSLHRYSARNRADALVVWSQRVNQRNNVLATCLIFEAARPPPGAAPGGSSWVGGIEGVDTCGVSPKLFASFFGAAGDAGRFFLGFRPRLLGMTMREVWHG